MTFIFSLLLALALATEVSTDLLTERFEPLPNVTSPLPTTVPTLEPPVSNGTLPNPAILDNPLSSVPETTTPGFTSTTTASTTVLRTILIETSTSAGAVPNALTQTQVGLGVIGAAAAGASGILAAVIYNVHKLIERRRENEEILAAMDDHVFEVDIEDFLR